MRLISGRFGNSQHEPKANLRPKITRSTLVLLISCRLLGTNPSPADLLSIGPTARNYSELHMKIKQFSFRKIAMKLLIQIRVTVNPPQYKGTNSIRWNMNCTPACWASEIIAYDKDLYQFLFDTCCLVFLVSRFALWLTAEVQASQIFYLDWEIKKIDSAMSP